MRSILAASLLLSTIVTGVSAQELTIAFAGYAPFGVNDLDGTLPRAAEFRLSLPATDRFAVEPFVDVGTLDIGGRRYTEGLWGVQVRQRIVRTTQDDSFAFSTYGVAGYYAAGSDAPPVFGLFGIGLHQPLTRYLTFRPEVHVLTFHVVPIGARFVAGFSLGQWRRTTGTTLTGR